MVVNSQEIWSGNTQRVSSDFIIGLTFSPPGTYCQVSGIGNDPEGILHHHLDIPFAHLTLFSLQGKPNRVLTNHGLLALPSLRRFTLVDVKRDGQPGDITLITAKGVTK